jgi:hypothetical protein
VILSIDKTSWERNVRYALACRDLGWLTLDSNDKLKHIGHSLTNLLLLPAPTYSIAYLSKVAPSISNSGA